MKRNRPDRRGEFPIVPIIFFVLSVWYAFLALAVKKASGPYWLNLNLDPAYVYLISGLQVFAGELPGQYEHPGTPLQIIIASIISFANIAKPLKDTVLAVLRHPEWYLDATWSVLACLSVGSLMSVAAFAYRRTRDVIFCLCLFLPAFIFLTFKSKQSADVLLPVAATVVPEHLLITLCNLYVLCTLNFLFRKDVRADRPVILWGIVCGVSLMTKVTFAPLLLMPFVMLKSWRERGILSVSCLATAIVSTLPIMSIYPTVFQWFLKAGGHSGWYGSGQGGLVDTSTYLPNLVFLLKEHVFIILLSVCGVLMLLIGTTEGREEGAVPLVTKRHWGAFVLMMTLPILATAKTPSLHYLVPEYALSGLFLALLYWGLRRPAVRRAFAVLITLAIVLLSAKAVIYAGELGNKMSRLQAFSQKVHRENNQCLIMPFYRSSSIPYALFFGNSWYFRNTFAAQLEQLYPESYFYDKWRGEISNFTAFVPLAVLQKRYSCILLFGSHDENWDSAMLTPLAEEEGEHLYRIKLGE